MQNQSLGVFQQRVVLEPNYQVTAIDYFKSYLFIGDQNGNVYRLKVNAQELTDMIPSQSDKPCQLSKQKIDSIKVIEDFGNLLVLAEDKIYYLSNDLKKLPFVNQKSQKVNKITHFTVNQTNQRQALLIGQNKFIQILELQKDQAEFKVSIQLEKNPLMSAFQDQQIYLAYKSDKQEYSYQQLVNNEGGISWEENKNFRYQCGDNPYIFLMSQNEILLTLQNNAIFVNSKGDTLTKSTIYISTDKIYSMRVVKDYLIIQYEQYLSVYYLNTTQSQEIQKIQGGVSGQGKLAEIKSLSLSGDQLFYAVANKLYVLNLIPYETTMKQLLQEGKVDIADKIFEYHNPSSKPEYKQTLSKHHLDTAWVVFKQLMFEGAMNRIENTDYDPRELISLFPDLIPLTKNQLSHKITISQLIQDRLGIMSSRQGQSKEAQVLQQEQYKTKAKEQLSIQLAKKKKKILADHANLTEIMQFKVSTYSPNNQQPGSVTVNDILELIDFVLVKCYLDLKQMDNLKMLLNDKQIYCKNLGQELINSITESLKQKDEYQDIIALTFEKFEQYEHALNIWKEIGTLGQQKKQEIAIKQTIKILKDYGTKEMIKNYFTWVLRIHPDNIAALIKDLKDISILDHDQMLDDYFKNVFKDESDNKKLVQVQEKYLETIIQSKKVEEERFHTRLAIMYIDQCFLIYPENTPLKDVLIERKDLSFYLKKFEELLNNSNSKYNASTLITKVQSSWMIQQEIDLYKRERRHEEALSKLIKNSEFKWAEQYSASQNDKLLTKLVKLYNDLILSAQNLIKQNPSQSDTVNLNKQIDIYRKNINNILKKYATHPQLDPLEVLNLIPEDWKLSDKSGADDGLFTFLSSVISYTMHQKRKTDSIESLSEMDAVNATYQLVKAKQAHVKISVDKKCPICTQPIGDKMFAVYPNGVVVHQKCIPQNSQSICPVSKQDFERTFKG